MVKRSKTKQLNSGKSKQRKKGHNMQRGGAGPAPATPAAPAPAATAAVSGIDNTVYDGTSAIQSFFGTGANLNWAKTDFITTLGNGDSVLNATTPVVDAVNKFDDNKAIGQAIKKINTANSLTPIDITGLDFSTSSGTDDYKYITDIDTALTTGMAKVNLYKTEYILFDTDKEIVELLNSLIAAVPELRTKLNNLKTEYGTFLGNFSGLDSILNKIGKLSKTDATGQYNYLNIYLPKIMQAGGVINDLSTLNTTKLKNISKSGLWKTMTNTENDVYAFDKANTIPHDLLQLDTNKEEIQNYFRKCDDLQVLYIKKHIELFKIFKNMVNLLKYNQTYSQAIISLLSPIAELATTNKRAKVKFRKALDGITQKKAQQDALLAKLTGTQIGGATKIIVESPAENALFEELLYIFNANNTDLQNYLAGDGTTSLEQLVANFETANPEPPSGSTPTTGYYADSDFPDYTAPTTQSPHPTAGTKWENFDKGDKGEYRFDVSRIAPVSISIDKDVQRAADKCYDLQILYLIKHVEVIEIFKINAYYYDMLMKQIVILLFILSLYKVIDTSIPTNTFGIRQIVTDLGKSLTEQGKVVQGGGGGNNNIVNENTTSIPPPAEFTTPSANTNTITPPETTPAPAPAPATQPTTITLTGDKAETAFAAYKKIISKKGGQEKTNPVEILEQLKSLVDEIIQKRDKKIETLNLSITPSARPEPTPDAPATGAGSSAPAEPTDALENAATVLGISNGGGLQVGGFLTPEEQEIINAYKLYIDSFKTSLAGQTPPPGLSIEDLDKRASKIQKLQLELSLQKGKADGVSTGYGIGAMGRRSRARRDIIGSLKSPEFSSVVKAEVDAIQKQIEIHDKDTKILLNEIFTLNNKRKKHPCYSSIDACTEDQKKEFAQIIIDTIDRQESFLSAIKWDDILNQGRTINSPATKLKFYNTVISNIKSQEQFDLFKDYEKTKREFVDKPKAPGLEEKFTSAAAGVESFIKSITQNLTEKNISVPSAITTLATEVKPNEIASTITTTKASLDSRNADILSQISSKEQAITATEAEIAQLTAKKVAREKLINDINALTNDEDFKKFIMKIKTIISKKNSIPPNAITGLPGFITQITEFKTKYEAFISSYRTIETDIAVAELQALYQLYTSFNDPTFIANLERLIGIFSNTRKQDIEELEEYVKLIKPLSTCHYALENVETDEKKIRIENVLTDIGISGLGVDKTLQYMKDASKLAEEINNLQNKTGEDYLDENVAKDIKQKLDTFKNQDSNIIKFMDDKAIRTLYEKVLGAAMVIVRVKPLRNHNTAPTLQDINTHMETNRGITGDFNQKINDFTVRDYIRMHQRLPSLKGQVADTAAAPVAVPAGPVVEIDYEREIQEKVAEKDKYIQEKEGLKSQIQSGGYKYEDILKIIPKNNKDYIAVGSFCSGQGNTTEYGPFGGIYTPEYNNFDIYAYLFGTNKLQYDGEPDEIYNPGDSPIKEVIIAPNEITKATNPNVEDYGSLNYPRNEGQNLMVKLNSSDNVVIFGFGFSGSGKTYALVEGNTHRADTVYEDNKNNKYDPSLLEQFIKDNSSKITSVEFLDIYPLGIPSINGKETIRVFCGTDNTEIIKPEKKDNMYRTPASETSKEIYGIPDGDTKYNKIINGITFENIKNKILALEKLRRNNLRILATPNNDESSRSFLQITLNLKNNNKLVFFDMPGTENTVRIKKEFIGGVIDEIVKKKYDDTNSTKLETNNDKHKNMIKTIFTEGNKDKNNKFLKEFEFCVTKTSTESNPSLLYIKKINTSQNSFSTDSTGSLEPNAALFKKYYLSATNFSKNAGIYKDDKQILQNTIAEIFEKITLFFNAKSVNSVKNLSVGEKVNIPNTEICKLVVDNFLKNVIFRKKDDFIDKNDSSKNKIYSTQEIKDITEFRYFNLIPYDSAKKNHFQLEDYDKTNIENIYDVYFNGSDKVLWEQKDNNNIKSILVPDRPLPDIRLLCYDTKNIELKSNFIYEYTKYDDGEDKPNPMIKYFIIIMNTVLHNVGGNIKTNDNKISESFYKTMIFFVYKYVDFIVKQGAAIMTNLEHLKFFFLSNTNNVANYNNKQGNDIKSKYLCDNTTLNKLGKDASKPEEIKPCYSITEHNRTYLKPTKVSATETINEKINLGKMQKYRLLPILQKLANQNPNLNNLDTKTYKNNSVDESTLDLFKSTDGFVSPAGNKKSLFVMFTNVKIFRDKEEYDKETDLVNSINIDTPQIIENLCTAEIDTLEFAQSISSTTQSGGPKATSGGAIHKKKFNMKELTMHNKMHKHKTHRNKRQTMKRSNHKQHLARRSRKM